MQIHSVNSEGLQRLLVLMEGSHWLNNKRNHNSSNNNSDCESPSTTTNNHETTIEPADDDKKDEETPSSTTSETPLGTISEKHVYKYRYVPTNFNHTVFVYLSCLYEMFYMISDVLNVVWPSRLLRNWPCIPNIMSSEIVPSADSVQEVFGQFKPCSSMLKRATMMYPLKN